MHGEDDLGEQGRVNKYPVRTCAVCRLKYEEPDHMKGLRCPWCGSAYVGVGLGFDSACRHALKKLRDAGHSGRVFSVTAHTVHFIEPGTDGVVHMVTLARDSQ